MESSITCPKCGKKAVYRDMDSNVPYLLYDFEIRCSHCGYWQKNDFVHGDIDRDEDGNMRVGDNVIAVKKFGLKCDKCGKMFDSLWYAERKNGERIRVCLACHSSRKYYID